MAAGFDSELFDKTAHGRDVLTLRSAVWGPDHPHTNVAFLRWLFDWAGPNHPSGATVRRRGKLVGFAGLCRKDIVVNGRRRLLAQGLDYMIMPELTGLVAGSAAISVARRWLDLARDLDCALGLVFPNENSYRILTSAHVGLAPMFAPALLIRPLPRIALTENIGKIPKRIGTVALRLAAVYGALQGATAGGPWELEQEERFGSEFDDLWASIAKRVRIGIVRDAAYLNWRYVDHPVYQYERLGARKGRTLAGSVVGTHRTILGVDSMLLVDIVARGGDEITNRGLISGFVEHAARRGHEMVVTLAIPGSTIYSALKHCGFVHVPRRLDPKPFRTAGILFDEAAACAWDPSAWYFTWGDMDVV